MITDFERTILDALLSGELPELEVLRAQAGGAGIRDRELTGVGFSLNFVIPPNAPRLEASGRRVISDVGAEVEGVEHGIGFLLFIQDGRLSCLEGFTYDERWPERVVLRRWFYLRPKPGKPGSLIEGSKREMNHLVSMLAGRG